MAKMGVPLVEGDLIVRDQAWATSRNDGRHYVSIAPMEIFAMLSELTSPFETPKTEQ